MLSLFVFPAGTGAEDSAAAGTVGLFDGNRNIASTEKRVATVFPELEIAAVISLRQLKNRDVSDLDLILTTVGLDFEISCPSVTVSVLLDPKDIEEVRRALKE